MISDRQFRMTLGIAGATMLAALQFLSLIALYAEDSHAGHNHGPEAHGEEGHQESTGEVTISPEAMKLFNVTVESAEHRSLVEVASFPARVAYNSEAIAHVGTPLNGRVAEIRARLGDVVAKGDVLAVIESPELGEAESDYLQKHSLRDAAKNAVEVAQIAFSRAEELRRTNSMSVTDFLARQGELKKAEGDLKVADAVFLASENRLHLLGVSQSQVARLLETGEVSSRFEARAPIAGRIIQRGVTPGEVVGPDRETLMTIADMSTLWVLADIPEQFSNRIAVDSPARIRMGAAGEYLIVGAVEYVSPQLDARTRTTEVRILVSASRPGEVVAEKKGPTIEPTYALAEADIQKAKDSNDWCVEHDVPDSRCPICTRETTKPVYTEGVIAAFQRRKDWCAEHKLPESRCAECNPALGSSPAAASLPAVQPTYELSDQEVAAARASGDWCGSHAAPESRCPLCGGDESRPVYSPEVIAVYTTKGDWCAEHKLPESKCAECNPSLIKQGEAPSVAPTAGDLLKPGMFGTAEIELSAIPGDRQSMGVSISSQAIQTMAGYPVVFVLAEDTESRFIPREVTIGRRVGEWVPVLAGIREGERYVASGSFLLKAELGKMGVTDPCGH